jgi:hypothetical protein
MGGGGPHRSTDEYGFGLLFSVWRHEDDIGSNTGVTLYSLLPPPLYSLRGRLYIHKVPAEANPD